VENHEKKYDAGCSGNVAFDIWGAGIALLLRAGYCFSAGGEERV